MQAHMQQPQRQLPQQQQLWSQQQLLRQPRAAPTQHSAARHRRRARESSTAAASSSSTGPEGAFDYSINAHFFPLGDGDAIRLPSMRPEAGPRYEYSREEAIKVQLQALQNNDEPYFDHGIETLYRFADFDPFQRSQYFGKSFDLGQFERFRRIMSTPAYKPLLNHEEVQIMSTLQLSERAWRTRLHVVGPYRKDEGVYEITMVQRLGGRFDGFFFCSQWVADGNDWKASIISY